MATFLLECRACGKTWESPSHNAVACPDCRPEWKRRQHREWAQRPENRERRLAAARAGGYARRNRLAKYGLTESEYAQMVEDCSNRCEICDEDSNRTEESLRVDHCHATGEVRGLLCHSCNIALGAFEDDLELLHRAAAYLRFWAATDGEGAA